MASVVSPRPMPDDGEPCPTCDETFASERGVKIHHKKAHGESIISEDRDCEWCGETFTAHGASDTRKYCSDDCRLTYRSESIQGEKHPRWVEKETKVCEQCGEEFTVRYTKNINRFCSRECNSAWQSEAFGGEDWHLSARGEEHPAWNGGSVEYYGENWPEQRDRCLERDDHRCRICGMTSDEHHEEHDSELHVHHIVRIAAFDEPEAANDLDNLATLCRTCHARWEGLPVLPN